VTSAGALRSPCAAQRPPKPQPRISTDCELVTPIILRELVLGSRKFNDIHRGVPRMSRASLGIEI
jgi:hypothetical protein